MKDPSIANTTFTRFETNIQDIIDRGYKEVVEDINRTLNGIVQSTVLNAEYTQKSINLALNDMKRSLKEEDGIDRTIIQSRKLVAPNIVRKYGRSFSKIHPQDELTITEEKEYNFSMSKSSSNKNKLEDYFRLDLLRKEEKYDLGSSDDTKNVTNVKEEKDKSSSRKAGKKNKLLHVNKVESPQSDEGTKTSLVCKLETLAESLASDNLIDDDLSKAACTGEMISEDTVNLTATKSIDNAQEHTDEINAEGKALDHTIMDDNFCCDQCSYTTKNKRNLLVHVDVTHRSLESFGCEQCGYVTTTRRNLLRHTNGVHSDNEKLKCQDCGRKFTQKESLNSHIKIIHYKIKSFICNDCGHSFGKRSNLDKHVKRRHEKGEGEKRKRKNK